MRTEKEIRDDIIRITRVIDNLADMPDLTEYQFSLFKAAFKIKRELFEELGGILDEH